MKFVIPWAEEIPFEIPSGWWKEAEMENFFPAGDHYSPKASENMKIVTISSIEPFIREVGLKKNRMIRILTGFRESSKFPPIEVYCKANDKRYEYALHDGYHRYYASIAVGYSKIPVVEGIWTEETNLSGNILSK